MADNSEFPEGLRKRIDKFVHIENLEGGGPIVRVIVGSQTFMFNRQDAHVMAHQFRMSLYKFCLKEQSIVRASAAFDDKHRQRVAKLVEGRAHQKMGLKSKERPNHKPLKFPKKIGRPPVGRDAFARSRRTVDHHWID